MAASAMPTVAPQPPSGSEIPGFTLMPDCEHHSQIAVHTVKNDIAAVPEGDQPFPELRVHLVGRAPDARMRGHDLHSFADRAHGTGRRIRVLGCK